MSFDFGKLGKIALGVTGAAVGGIMTGGVGALAGYKAGTAAYDIGDAVIKDVKDDDSKKQSASNNGSLDIGNALAGFSGISGSSGSDSALDLSKKFLFS